MRTGLAALALALLCQRAARADALEEAGDILQYALPIGALTGTFIAGDWQGTKMFTASWVTGYATVGLTKLTVEKWRPSQRNPQSFPSGHTYGAFSGAAFLDMRYGWQWGLPTYALAILTGYSRVDSQNHFADDVISGASIALLSNAMWTTPIGDGVKVKPVMNGNGQFGVLFNISDSEGKRSKQGPAKDFVPRWRYEWELGAAWETKNIVQSPSSTGDPIDLTDFTDVNSGSIPTAQISLERYLGPELRHEILLRFFPYERRDRGSFAQPTSFAGTTYPANSPTDFAFVQYEIRLRYRYELLPKSRFNIKIGGGLTVLDTRVEMVNFSTGQSSRASDTALSPILHLHLSYDVLRNLRLLAEIDGGWAGTNTYFADAALLVRWAFNPRWHLSFGYRFYGQEFDEDNLFNRLQLHRLVLGLAYMW